MVQGGASPLHSVATHFEKITHFEFFSKCVKFGTKSKHFEIFFQSALRVNINITFDVKSALRVNINITFDVNF